MPQETETLDSESTSTGDGAGVVEPDQENDAEDDAERKPGERISSPRKVMRIASMLKQVLEEANLVDLTKGTRFHLTEVQAIALETLQACLSPDLQAELTDLTKPFAHAPATSDAPAIASAAELRIELAQLVGWLDGLLQGVQSALAAGQGQARSAAVFGVATTSDGRRSGGLLDDGVSGGQSESDPRPGRYL